MERDVKRFLNQFMALSVVGMFFLILSGFDKPGGSGPAIIIIRSATYGGNFGGVKGNATRHVQSQCARGEVCEYTIKVENFGDPAPNRGKDFRVDYACRNGVVRPEIYVPGEAGLGSRITLDCSGNGK